VRYFRSGLAKCRAAPERIQRDTHSGGKPDPIGWRVLGRFRMTDSKVHIDVLVEETIALTKSISVQSPPPPPVEPAPMPPVNLRDELRERVSNFKALQQRFTREREDYAASQIKRMRERSRPGSEAIRRWSSSG
jgi:hypothetical protein